VSADSLSRILAAALSDSLGGPVIVDAKPGAGGNIASEFVSRATPDGYGPAYINMKRAQLAHDIKAGLVRLDGRRPLRVDLWRAHVDRPPQPRIG